MLSWRISTAVACLQQRVQKELFARLEKCRIFFFKFWVFSNFFKFVASSPSPRRAGFPHCSPVFLVDKSQTAGRTTALFGRDQAAERPSAQTEQGSGGQTRSGMMRLHDPPSSGALRAAVGTAWPVPSFPPSRKQSWEGERFLSLSLSAAVETERGHRDASHRARMLSVLGVYECSICWNLLQNRKVCLSEENRLLHGHSSEAALLWKTFMASISS